MLKWDGLLSGCIYKIEGIYCKMSFEQNHQEPLIEISPTYLEFGTLDLERGDLPAGQFSLHIKNIGGGVLSGQINPQFNWVEVVPPSFQLSAGQSGEFNIILSNAVTRSDQWSNIARDNFIFINSNGGALSVGGRYLVPPLPAVKSRFETWQIILSLTIVVLLFAMMLFGGLAALDRRTEAIPSYVDVLYTQGAETMIAQLTLTLNEGASQPAPASTAIIQNWVTDEAVPIAEFGTDLPIQTLTFTPWPRADFPNPEQFVIEYYSGINNRDYETTWNHLTPEFQKNCCSIAGNNPYIVYVNWWDSVEKVEVLSAYIQDWNANPAIVHTQVNYQYRNGGSDEIIHIVEVISDDVNQTLKINQVW
jgi:hypothetical protein